MRIIGNIGNISVVLSQRIGKGGVQVGGNAVQIAPAAPQVLTYGSSLGGGALRKGFMGAFLKYRLYGRLKNKCKKSHDDQCKHTKHPDK